MTRRNADDDTPRAEGFRGVSVAAETARAKVNLTLEVLGRRADGYHELRSLVAFADCGDTLRLIDPTAPFSLEIDGPFAAALEGGNLVEAAAALHAGMAAARRRTESAGETSATGSAALAHHVPPGERAQGAFSHAAALIRAEQPSPLEGEGGRRRRPGEGATRPHPTAPVDPDHGQTLAPASAEPGPPNQTRGQFRLTKRIPVAAGLGGGSADAAAALRLLAATAPESEQDAADTLLSIAARLGADVPVCLLSRAAIMTGIGERLSVLSAFPRIPAVLANPRAPLATAAVFRELRAAPLATAATAHILPTAFHKIDAVLDYAKHRHNDLEAPACRLLPAIGALLDRLARCPGAVLTRLSGSGPTCFALFRKPEEAVAAAASLRAEQPGWWVEATLLG